MKPLLGYIQTYLSLQKLATYISVRDRRDFKGSLGLSQFPFLSLIIRLIYNER